MLYHIYFRKPICCGLDYPINLIKDCPYYSL
nr:MAG TPA: hypothetical protein [Caudoviricetes sp.]